MKTNFTEETLVTDSSKNHYGVGRVEKVTDEDVTVWYDEVEKMVYYDNNEEGLKNLKELD